VWSPWVVAKRIVPVMVSTHLEKAKAIVDFTGPKFIDNEGGGEREQVVLIDERWGGRVDNVSRWDFKLERIEVRA